jgi:patatin-related protein
MASGGSTDYTTSEIRIAVVLNGGVSLAVWMSGVTLELHHLALASQNLGEWRAYRRVLCDVLHSTARIDVIAGTSAGGLNGAFLALGQVKRHDLALMRDLWVDKGGLSELLRPADEKNPPSVLRGDDYFLVCLNKSLRELADADDVPNSPGTSKISGGQWPVELYLTGTLWTGRESPFTDDMGVAIIERDYDATFAFASQVTGPLKDSPGDLENSDADQVVIQLANASRCTSSFPGAFEPHRVVLAKGQAAQGRWAAERRWASRAGELRPDAVRARRRHLAEQADPPGPRGDLSSAGRASDPACARLCRP